MRSAAAAHRGKSVAAAASKCQKYHTAATPFAFSNMKTACRPSVAAGTEVRYNEHSVCVSRAEERRRPVELVRPQGERERVKLQVAGFSDCSLLNQYMDAQQY